ncbi:hypothetical protein RHSIM_Rhsim10G0077600 [Rhododendron simsii]|uniref:Uncharacterized protein n=1 Tax=Rhododendron simsii TaxID=118357 RepID=A0A834GCY2_RHOSS|nr:hypothetical protein RHSIM_Rhsim10G0077600 [Rhododendron simsii]
MMIFAAEGADGIAWSRDRMVRGKSEAPYGATWQKGGRHRYRSAQAFHVAIREWTGWHRFSSGVRPLGFPPPPSSKETIRNLSKGYRMGNVGFDESLSNFTKQPEQPVIPGIHVPLQVDDRASRDILYGRGDSFDEVAEPIPHGSEPEEDHAERTTAGAQANTSTSEGAPTNAPNAGGARAPKWPPRDIDAIPPLPTTFGPIQYSHFYGDGPMGFTKDFRAK